MKRNRNRTTLPSRSRQAVSLNLTPQAARLVSTVRQETGITQMSFLERLIEWFAAQDPRIRTMILSPYMEVRKGLATLVLEDMLDNPTKDFDGMPGFDALIDHDFRPAEDMPASGAGEAATTPLMPPARGHPSPRSKRGAHEAR